MYKYLVLVLTVAMLAPGGLSEKIYENCGDSIQCAEQNLVKLVDDVDSKPTISLLGDYLILEKTNEETLLPRSQEGIFERLLRYMNNHELKLRFPSQESARHVLEEARKSKLKRLILPILLLLKLKALVIIPTVLFLIALVAFKGVGVGLMALFVSSGLALKHILERSSSSSFSYEVVPQPHWSRSGLEGWTGIVPSYQSVAH